jgi:hypothetical protein
MTRHLHLLQAIGFASDYESGVRRDNRLLDLDGLGLVAFGVVTNEKIPKPRSWDEPRKVLVLVGSPEVLGVADALLNPVVLIVADRLVLGFELNCGD